MIHSAPRQGRESTPVWQAAKEGRLELPCCASCGKFEWPARRTCSACGEETQMRQCAGTGTLVTFSVIHRAVNPELNSAVPYVIAFVMLDEGVRIFTNIVDCDPATLQCGQPVRCRFEETKDPDLWVPVFAPV